jgi:hypothetical protein
MAYLVGRMSTQGSELSEQSSELEREKEELFEEQLVVDAESDDHLNPNHNWYLYRHDEQQKQSIVLLHELAS